MNPLFLCPKCKDEVIEANQYSCSQCSIIYSNKEEGFFDFITDSASLTNKSNNEIQCLLFEIGSYGYFEGKRQFLKNHPVFKDRFDNREADIVFHCINKNNTRCLVLNSDLGNIPEALSKIFHEVYSLDENREKIIVQKSRFKETKLNNIILVRSIVSSLPFPENYFDLIVFNGTKIFQKTDDSLKAKTIECFEEVRRVLTPSGCFCVGVENKHGLKILGKGNVNYDVHPDSHISSFFGYNSIFKSLGFKVKSYWVLPSYKKPYFSGNIEDEISLKWFLQNLDKLVSKDNLKLKIMQAVLKILDIKIKKVVMKLFMPYFLFYCYKKDIPKTLEDIIIEKTRFKNFICISRRIKFIYVLLDKLGKPKNALSCKRIRYDLTENIFPVKRVFPKMKDPDEKILIEDWVEGNILNPMNSKEVEMAMRWLINFQKNTSSGSFTFQEIDYELENLKNCLDKREEMKGLPHKEWLNEYRIYVSRIKLKKTAVHGDFWYRNILVDSNSSSVNVIDWEMFQEKGNPFQDFMTFILFLMTMSDDPIEEFRSYLNKNGKRAHIITIIKDLMNEYFQTELNFPILLRYIILNLLPRSKIRGDRILTYIELLKILSDKKHPISKMNRENNCQK